MELNKTTGFQIISSFNVVLNDLQIIFLTIEIIIGTVTILGSSVVLALYYHERKSNKNSYKYFTAMAIGDLVQGFVTPAICIYFALGVTVSDPFCFESIVIGFTAVLVSMLVMLAMSIDRYYAIMKPIEYKSTMTSEKTIGIIITCVILAFVGAGATALGRKPPTNPDALCFVFTEIIDYRFNMIFLGLIVTPCLITFVYTYVRIYKVILDAMGSTVSHTTKFLELGKIVIRRNTKTKNGSEDKMLYGRFKVREVRTALILFITVLLFLFGWVPGMFLSAVLYYFPECSSLEGILTVCALSQLNSMVNPFLYARNIKNAEEILKNWIRCLLCRKTVKIENHSPTGST